jgi:hypothetical protein
MEFKFSVGVSDRHQVRFQYSRLRNTVQIDIDGKRVKEDVFRIWIPAVRRYDFKVGETEQHDVLIVAQIPRFGAKFRNPECSVIVDGELVHEY